MSFPKLETHGEIAREHDAEGNPYSNPERQPARFRAVVRDLEGGGRTEKNRKYTYQGVPAATPLNLPLCFNKEPMVITGMEIANNG